MDNENKNMDTNINTLDNIIDYIDNINKSSNKKILKKERGLIERTESSKMILSEDNRLLLND